MYNDGSIGVSDLVTRPDGGVTVIAPPRPGNSTTPPLFMGNFTGSIHAPASYVDLARAAGDKDRGDLSIPPKRRLGFVVAQSINVAGANIVFPTTSPSSPATSPNAGTTVLSWHTGDRFNPTTLAASSSPEVYYPSASSIGAVPEESYPTITWTGTITDTTATYNSDRGINTVICTEMYRQGYLSEAWYAADTAFGRAYLDAGTFAVYHAWARPLVRAMQHSLFITQLVRPWALAWAQHMAYTMGVSNEDNPLGYWLNAIGLPLHRAVGHWLVEHGLLQLKTASQRR